MARLVPLKAQQQQKRVVAEKVKVSINWLKMDGS
jgi:hypothetical protein